MVNERLALLSRLQNRADAVDHVLHGERRQQHAEQPRQHDIAGLAEQPADALGENEGDPARQARSAARRQSEFQAGAYCRRRAPASSTVAVMAPGPASSGIASGKAAMLRTCSSSACSASSPSWRLRTPNTISDAIENSSSPPAMRNADSEISSVARSQSPISAAPIRIAPAMMLARTATLLPRCARHALGHDQKGRRQARPDRPRRTASAARRPHNRAA